MDRFFGDTREQFLEGFQIGGPADFRTVGNVKNKISKTKIVEKETMNLGREVLGILVDEDSRNVAGFFPVFGFRFSDLR